ncbi:MAG: transporter substrate-binding domain-containing protein [Pseudanabaenaceae cyanobacterium]
MYGFVLWGLPPVVGQVALPTWEQVLVRGYLRVGVKDNLPALALRSPTGEIEGLEIDIARELAQELLGDRNAVRLVVLSNSERLNAFDRVDIVIAQVAITNNRSRLVDFSPPYYTDGTILIAKQGQTLNQLRGILVLKGSTAIAHLQQHYPNLPTIGIDSYPAGITALQTLPNLAMAGDRSVLLPWLQANPEYQQLGGQLSFHSLGIVMPKGLASAELRQRVRQAMQKWRQNGWLTNLAQKWGL